MEYGSFQGVQCGMSSVNAVRCEDYLGWSSPDVDTTGFNTHIHVRPSE